MASAPWLFSLSLMWFGWGASTTMLGIASLVIGTAWALGLAAQERTPRALLAFTAVWTLGWIPALVWVPWLLLAPAGLVTSALLWRRREPRWRVRLREFHEQER